jgi:catechol 2,3-dioxygenase-like lactoylglutathione lyase family enzyme
MEKLDLTQLPFAKFDHFGVVVRDMEKALACYQACGIGPFELMHLTTFKRRLRGKPADDIQQALRMGKIGQTRLELIQPISGESIHTNSLRNRGEGINHIGFVVDAIDQEVARLISKGFRLVYTGKFNPSGGMAYFESEIGDSYYLEVVQWPPD